MALKLDENYNGSTLLSEWWQKVKSNFAAIKVAIEQETTDRTQKIAEVEAEVKNVSDQVDSNIESITEQYAMFNCKESSILGDRVQANADNIEDINRALDGEFDSNLGDRIAKLEDKKVDKTQYANNEQYGLVRIQPNGGLYFDNSNNLHVRVGSAYGTMTTSSGGTLYLVCATNSEIDGRTNKYKPIVPSNLEYAVQSVAGKYSTTPVQVGTWIDGNPIWRIAFDEEIKVEEYIIDNPGGSKFEYMLSGVFDYYLIDANKAHIHSYNAQLRIGAPCYIDDVNLIMDSIGYASCNADLLRYGDDGHDGVYGWVEFVTPAENVRIG